MVPRTIAEISPAWLTQALRQHGSISTATVTARTVEVIGKQVGFLDVLARLRLSYDRVADGAPASVVVKLPSSESSYRAIGDRYHAYEREIRFYGDVAPHSPIRLPRCFYLGMDREANAYLLVLEDLGALTAGDEVNGLTPEQARAAVETLGRFHACWWGKPSLEALTWMPSRYIQPDRYRSFWPRFREKVGTHLPAQALALGEKVGFHLESLICGLERRPRTIVHSDCRADNVLLDDPSRPDSVVVLDWQLAIRGPGILDVARLLCESLAPSDRARCEKDALESWHETLREGGVRDLSFEQVLEDYRRAALVCLYHPVTIHEAEEAAGKRGVALAHAQIERVFTAALELDGESALPKDSGDF